MSIRRPRAIPPATAVACAAKRPFRGVEREREREGEREREREGGKRSVRERAREIRSSRFS